MISIYTLLVVAALLMQAFFTSTEMAFTSLSRIKLRDLAGSGDKKALRLEAFLSREGAFISTTLVGTNLAVVISSALATRIFTAEIGPVFAPLAATVVMVPVTLICAEIVPKMIARQIALQWALGVVSAVENFHRAFYPLIVAINSVCSFILSPFKRIKRGDFEITRRDLRQMIYMSHETGGVGTGEAELIHKVLDFETKRVGKIMVPLYRVSSVSSGESAGNIRKLAGLTGFSRMPVYGNNKSELIGIVNIYDILFDAASNGQDGVAGDFLRDPVYIDAEDRLDIALARLKNRKQPMGIVVDASGKTVGIISIEDILEEIVGEI